MKKHRNFATRREARKRSRAMLKARVLARQGKWREAGTAADGFKYPAGEWPGKPVGKGRHCRPEIGIATYAVVVKTGANRLDGRFLVEDESGEDITEDDIFVPEPEEVPVPRERTRRL